MSDTSDIEEKKPFANVVWLHSTEPYEHLDPNGDVSPDADPDTVRVAENILARAKNGTIKGISAVALVGDDLQMLQYFVPSSLLGRGASIVYFIGALQFLEETLKAMFDANGDQSDDEDDDEE